MAAIDVWLPDSAAVSMGYAGPVLLGLAARRGTIALVLASLATLTSAAVGGQAVLRHPDVVAVAERAVALCLVWIVAGLVVAVLRHRKPGSAARDLLRRDDIFEAVFDQTFQFVAALDPYGRIVAANRTLRDYAGVSAGEIQAVFVWRLPIFRNDPAARDRLRDAVAAAAVGDFVRDKFNVSGVGDRTTVIDLSLKPIRDKNGAVHQVIMEGRDMTEVAIQQEMLVQAQKMEAVGELTAGVAHDFNNLLTVIVGNLEILEARLKDNPGAVDRLQRAIKAAFHGQALTQELLAFSRRQPLNPVVTDVNALLQGMSQLYEALGDDVRVEFDLSEGLPYCEVDPSQLESAILNLAINARDAMPEGGLLRFQTVHASMDGVLSGGIADVPEGRYVCIAVSDTGSGIPANIVDQVFDPFFTTKSTGQGTGLGLSMVYGFVKQSGGDVRIQSQEDAGTTVRLFLPATDRPLPDVALPESDDRLWPDEVHKAVLLVDDDDEIRDVVHQTLTELGCEVDAARDGDDALDLLRAGRRYDLVFTDVVMSADVGGPEVAAAARARLPDVSVVFCSGFPRSRLNGKATWMAGTYFLAKPFRRHQLVSMVEKALNHAASPP